MSQPDFRNPKSPDLPQIFGALHPSILAFLHSRLRPSLGLDHEALASQVMVDLFNGLWAGKWPEIETLDQAKSMAFRIAQMDVIDALRKLRRLKENELGDDWEQQLGDPLQQMLDAEGELAGQEKFEALLELLNPPEVRPKLFKLYFTKGHTYQELADQFKMGVGDVCSHFSRGLKKLRDLISSGRLDPRTGRLRQA